MLGRAPTTRSRADDAVASSAVERRFEVKRARDDFA